MRVILVVAAVGLFALACTGGSSQDERSAASSEAPVPAPDFVALSGSAAFECPVTIPNGTTPPGEKQSSNHHGNDGTIWTGFWPDGKVIFSRSDPGAISHAGVMSTKWGWWRAIPGELRIEGRRLDGAGILEARIPDGYGETGFQVSALIFSSAGCWEVTGRVGSESLTFVTEVVIVP